MVATYTKVHTHTEYACPTYGCATCHVPVKGFTDEYRNWPCDHKSDYYDVCMAWSPVTGCPHKEGEHA